MRIRALYLKYLIMLHFLVHYLRLYSTWSKTYRFIWQKKYDHIQVDHGLSPLEANQRIAHLVWKPDGIREFFDAIGSTQFVQHCINEVKIGNEQPIGALDCDDFAAWCQEAISREYETEFFTVSWLAGWSVRGHAVCLYKDHDGFWYHIGNWGMCGPYVSKKDAQDEILTTVRISLADQVGFSKYNKDLSLKEVGASIKVEV